MNKPDPLNSAKYEVLPTEKVTIRIESIGVAPLVKAAVDGPPGLAGPPFKFTVNKPPGALHVASVECAFPPLNPPGAKHVIYVSGSLGGPEYLVDNIYPDTRDKEVDIEFFVK